MELSALDKARLAEAADLVKTLITSLEPHLTVRTCPSCGAKRYNDFPLFQTLEKLKGIASQLSNLGDRLEG